MRSWYADGLDDEPAVAARAADGTWTHDMHLAPPSGRSRAHLDPDVRHIR